MKIKGNEILWKSENGNIAVAFSKFDMGDKYKIYQKILFVPENLESWDFLISFGTMGEAVSYAGKIHDEPALR